MSLCWVAEFLQSAGFLGHVVSFKSMIFSTHSVCSPGTHHLCRFYFSIDVLETTLLCDMRQTLRHSFVLFPSVKLQSNIQRFTKSSHQHEPVINSFTAWARMLLFFLCVCFNHAQHNTGQQLMTLGTQCKTELQKMVNLQWPICVVCLSVPAFFTLLYL